MDVLTRIQVKQTQVSSSDVLQLGRDKMLKLLLQHLTHLSISPLCTGDMYWNESHCRGRQWFTEACTWLKKLSTKSYTSKTQSCLQWSQEKEAEVGFTAAAAAAASCCSLELDICWGSWSTYVSTALVFRQRVWCHSNWKNLNTASENTTKERKKTITGVMEEEEVWLELRGHFLLTTPAEPSELSRCGRVQLLLGLSSFRKMLS